MSTILAVETSCDETGVAVLQKGGEEITVLAQALASQVDVHALTGGVVPEVAAREHVKVIGPLIQKVVKEAGIKNPESNLKAIAVTVGPGLIPALAVGVQAARTLAYVWKLPIVPVHHIEGHIYSALPATEAFPALALIVSGGHTMLILINNHLHYEVVGETRDDAAGEAFDKVARLLELPYPGGPSLSTLAVAGDKATFPFPRPMMNTKDFDFSFSGLKTAVLYTLRDNPAAAPADIAASFQQAVVEVLVEKTRRAAEKYQPKTLLLAGGVAANILLREQLAVMAGEARIPLHIAPPELCGDNAVMIGQVGLRAYEQGRIQNWRDVDARARVSIETFSTT